MKELENRTILITGGSMGIGFIVAKACVRAGARVILVSRHVADLEHAVRELTLLGDYGHGFAALDVGDRAAVSAFANRFENDFGPLYGLVNCAGVYGPIGKIHQVDMGEFENTLRINFLGTVFMCHFFLPLLLRCHGSRIVNYSGGGSTTPFPHYDAYATSKVAIVRFTENVALEFQKSELFVNAVAPGFIITRFHEQTLRAGAERAGQEFLIRTTREIERGGQSPERAAKLTVFLLSHNAFGVSAKLISAQWDPWEDSSFVERLKTDPDFCTLRRIDDQYFFKKS
jgi:NAD(P)-dependent dehydrogenase (short-subunit alcohol dehydrogenase family)